MCVPGALVGGCSGRKRPYPCSRRVWQAQRTLARALAAGCNTTAFPGNRVLVLHVFLHLCSLRLVVGMCQAASVTAQLLVRRHRRAKRRAAHAPEQTGRARRRGSWHPKPRNGNPDAIQRYLQWRYDTSKSLWWPLLNSAESHVERSYMGAKFHDEFHMPRGVFDSVVAVLRPEFPDRLLGTGGSARLYLKPAPLSLLRRT